MERIGNNSQMYNEPSVLDELTGVYTMSWIMTPIAVTDDSIALFINVMNFKGFNRRFGFEGGNGYLRQLAHELREIFADHIVARAGGDHFIVITKKLTDKDIEAKIHLMDEAMAKYDRGLHMHIKVGIYHGIGDEPSFLILIDRAKIACDMVSKGFDRDYLFFDDDLKKRNELNQYVVDHLEDAFKKEYFCVYYQPIIRAVTGQVCGYEALARWKDPKYGMIPPSVFVEVLENVRLIHLLDHFMIEHVCKDLRNDIDSGFNYQPISLNLSQLDFELCDVQKILDDCTKKYDIPHELLIVEVTESAVATTTKWMKEQIHALRELGFKVWIDDFGSGYSSFNNLQNYDFDTLKIDMEFVRGLNVNPKSNVIVASIISMSKRLQIPTLAEGVETKEQYDLLRRIGCEKIQGYYFGKPNPAEYYLSDSYDSHTINEDLALREYLDKASSINFLSNTPLLWKKNPERSAYEVYNSLPITLLEMDYDTGEIRFLYNNDAYLKFINSFGIEDISDVQDFFGDIGKSTMMNAFAESELTGERVDFDAPFDDVITISCKVRFLARAGNKAVFGFVAKLKETII